MMFGEGIRARRLEKIRKILAIVGSSLLVILLCGCCLFPVLGFDIRCVKLFTLLSMILWTVILLTEATLTNMEHRATLTIVEQKNRLQKAFPEGRTNVISSSYLEWECEIQPTPISTKYTVVVKYVLGTDPLVFVKEKLPLAKGKEFIPYMLSCKDQQLGLYRPNSDEWNGGMFLAETVVPWAQEWLCFYEIWVITGTWYTE